MALKGLNWSNVTQTVSKLLKELQTQESMVVLGQDIYLYEVNQL